eukprot:10744976-Lingulodinium_polyedra.AAC.1
MQILTHLCPHNAKGQHGLDAANACLERLNALAYTRWNARLSRGAFVNDLALYCSRRRRTS